MFIGSLQTSPDTSVAGAFPNPANVTGENYTNINNSINLLQGLVNSGIFTGGVIFFTVVFGLLVGYALAQMHFRGKGAGVRHDAAGADDPVPAAADPAVRA